MVGRHPLNGGLPERWAAEWGEDHHGVFTAFAVGAAAQRMRWVPPGRFLMGSPDNEAGRYKDEGPQHEVELSHGFWLADTPCTQALWQAVMASNPSQFVSPDRPVETVSWEDCKEFLKRLGPLVPGLGARLPTEAEWEYACRAGTTTATWVGDLDIKGANNAPRLDAIAWYGGNSGHGFELAEGRDSSNWTEKQYPHTKAGTHPVRRKRPNPLGLHDMLGNVSEWCEDWNGEYDPTAAIDPQGPETGWSRVLRGASWFGRAWLVRAAMRDADGPSKRNSHRGFRLARNQPRSPPADPTPLPPRPPRK